MTKFVIFSLQLRDLTFTFRAHAIGDMHKQLKSKPDYKRQFPRPRHRWANNIEVNLNRV